MKSTLMALVAALFVIAVFVGALWDFDTSAMSMHGWIALALATVLSVALGGGLMALMFYSARRGYDDRIQRDEPDEPEH